MGDQQSKVKASARLRELTNRLTLSVCFLVVCCVAIIIMIATKLHINSCPHLFESWIFWLFAFVVFIVVFLAISFLYVKKITRPLWQITDYIEHLDLNQETIAPIPISTNDEIAALVGVFNQVLEEMGQHKTALKEQVHFLQVLLDALPVSIFFKDADLKYLGCNSMFENDMGVNRQELLGKTVHEIVEADLAERYHQADMDLLAQTGTHIYEGSVSYADESHHEVIMYKAKFFNSDGSLGGLVGTFLDITERKHAEDALSEQKEFSESLVLNTTIPTFVIDAEHRVITWNRACEVLTGISAEHVIGTNLHWQAFYTEEQPCLADVVLDAEKREVHSYRNHYSTSQHCQNGILDEKWFPLLNGKDRYILFSAAPIYNHHGEVIAVIETLEDQTEQHRLLEQLGLLGQAVEQSPATVMVTDRVGKIEYVNPKFVQLSGYKQDEVLGKTPAILKSGHMVDQEYQLLWETIRAGQVWNGEFLNKKKNGELYWESASISPVYDNDNEIAHYVAVKEDITQRKKNEEQLLEKEHDLYHLARHDSLTGLPNRLLFEDRLEHAIRKAERNQKQVALFLIDLDRFKNVNDSLGHNVGDLVLQRVAAQMTDCLRESDTVVRFSGDEFVVICEDIGNLEKVALLAQKLLEVVARPIKLDDFDLFVTSSIGISLFPDDGQNAEALLSSADVAMYRTKSRGRNGYTFYTPDMNAKTHEFLLLESALRKALELGQFELYYQPQIDLASRTLIGVEALIRWHDPQRGMISPADFIPLAEETGLIVSIGRWVLKTACDQVRSWHSQGYEPFPVAVNISGHQFSQPAFVDTVIDTVSAAGVDPRWIELEITESVIMDSVDDSITTLNELRKAGFQLSIDDFGTGYSSLSYLKRFPISKLKIDQSFVCDITNDENDAAIVCAIIGLTKSLDFEVIAEGVEDEDQARYLIQNGCLQAQGYLFSRPLTVVDLEESFLASGRKI